MSVIVNYRFLIEPIRPEDEPAVTMWAQADSRANDAIPGYVHRHQLDWTTPARRRPSSDARQTSGDGEASDRAAAGSEERASMHARE